MRISGKLREVIIMNLFKVNLGVIRVSDQLPGYRDSHGRSWWICGDI